MYVLRDIMFSLCQFMNNSEISQENCNQAQFYKTLQEHERDNHVNAYEDEIFKTAIPSLIQIIVFHASYASQKFISATS